VVCCNVVVICGVDACGIVVGVGVGVVTM